MRDKAAELRIDNGMIVTMNERREIIKEGSIVIDQGSIVALGKTKALANQYPAQKIIDARNKIVMPGLIDAHVHNTQMLARGLGDDLDLIPWCFDYIYPYEAEMTDQDTYYSTLLCAMEMIRTGTTCVVDPGGYRMDYVAKALQDFGMRGIISWAGMDEWSPERHLPEKLPGRLSTRKTLEEEERLVSAWHKKAEGLLRASYALRVESNVSADLYREITRLAKRDGVMIQMHAAVTKSQVEFVRKKTGLTTIYYLDSLGVLGPEWFLSHLSVVDEQELQILIDKGVRVCHNPGSSMHGGYGACAKGRIPEMIQAGMAVALGADGSSSNNSLDMFRTLWQVATVHKEARQRCDLIPPEQALELATIQGAKTIQWDDEIGSLEAGKKADLIIVDCYRPNWLPLHDFSIISNLVYAGSGDDVETVVINGKIIMENREFMTIPKNVVLKEAQSISERIIASIPKGARLKARWPVQ
ncbi:MAG TPA: amidohydrolase [Clostridia bacterium]|nr:amidohydrolase [Clostridia bacterium]